MLTIPVVWDRLALGNFRDYCVCPFHIKHSRHRLRGYLLPGMSPPRRSKTSFEVRYADLPPENESHKHGRDLQKEGDLHDRL